MHIAIGLTQHYLGIDQKDKTTLHEIKIKARISMCQTNISRELGF